ncbi:MAG: hypothetical protein E6Q27_06845 [Aeromicrobium sp.]|nr:MAG: hypothetical protein E6Q27_06845 [Aeromicrobium sp.]
MMAAYQDPGLTSREQLAAGRMPRRICQLLVGLALFGWSMAMMVRAGLGVMPWDVLHQGLADHLPWTFGQIVIAVGAIVLILWIPLKQWPGLGTILNVLLIGPVADLGLRVIDEPATLWGSMLLMIGGVVLNGLAGALYIGVHLGTGPRDGLGIALHRLTGRSVRQMRSFVEILVVIVGWLLGGVVGVGTLLYALGVGPLLQLFLPFVQVDLGLEQQVAE